LEEGWYRRVFLYGAEVCLPGVINYHPRRSIHPHYAIVIRNQTDTRDGDFRQTLDGAIRFEVKEGTFFFQYVIVSSV
jgi:hypothetical protein